MAQAIKLRRHVVPLCFMSGTKRLSFPVTAAKVNHLYERMEQLELSEDDLQESFYSGQGKGGQKRSRTASGVALIHKASGLRVRCQRERGQSINRFLARRMLVEELEARKLGKTRHEVKADKLREQKVKKGRLSPKSFKKPASLKHDKKKTLAELEEKFLFKPQS